MEERRNLEKLESDYLKDVQRKKNWKDFFKLGEVGGYFFRSKDPSRASNINIKMMHGVNKISMIMFLICVLIIIFRVISRRFF